MRSATQKIHEPVFSAATCFESHHRSSETTIPREESRGPVGSESVGGKYPSPSILRTHTLQDLAEHAGLLLQVLVERFEVGEPAVA